jgi:hypothetical protein
MISGLDSHFLRSFDGVPQENKRFEMMWRIFVFLNEKQVFLNLMRGKRALIHLIS